MKSKQALALVLLAFGAGACAARQQRHAVISAGPASPETLGVEHCVFGQQGQSASELKWRVTSTETTKVRLTIRERWARVQEASVPIDDREIRGKDFGLKPHEPLDFTLWLGSWQPRTDDVLSFKLWATFPDGEQMPVPNSSCVVPAPPPRSTR